LITTLPKWLLPTYGAVFAAGLLALMMAIVFVGCGGSNAPTTGEKSIYIAAEEGDLETVAGYIEAGFDPNQPDADGWTLLHHAAKRDQIDLAETLLEEYRVPLNAKTNDGKTALEIAYENESGSVIYLIEEEQ